MNKMISSTIISSAPKPYFRLHIINASSKSRSLIDTLNARPYMFNFTVLQMKSLISKGHVRVWTPTISSLVHWKSSQLENFIKRSLKEPSVITYFQHIHETPVPMPSKIEIIKKTESYVVVNKPPGVPVHATQKYYYNTVHAKLAEQLKISRDNLLPIHRLDKLTSGILIWAFNTTEVSKFKNKDPNTWIKQKIYLARITGRLQQKQITCTDDLVYLYPTRHMVRIYTNTETKFKEVFYDKILNESVVSAELKTGYPHQIRIHLRNIGHPIIDDPLYGLNGKYREIKLKREEITEEYWNEILCRSENIKKSKTRSGKPCTDCGALPYTIPSAKENSICLHAWKYKWIGVPGGIYGGETHVFESRVPSWGEENVNSL